MIHQVLCAIYSQIQKLLPAASLPNEEKVSVF